VQPKTRYARTPEGDVAYQIISDGPVDLIFAPEAYSNIEIMWEEPLIARFFERLASIARVIVLNFRGCGVSDRLPRGRDPTTESWADDIRTVLQTVGSDRAFVAGHGAAGIISGLFAATEPERVTGLIFLEGAAHWRRVDDYPDGLPMDFLERMATGVRRNWGTGENLDIVAPSLATDPRFREWYGRYERLCCGPGEAEMLLRWGSALDFRGVLPSIQTPTLVVCRKDNRVIRSGNSRYLA
jgi:pimeloyl-ACP methyl ester carboxylesterase